MLGSRNRNANVKQTPKRPASSQRSGLLAGSSDGVEGSCSSSSNSSSSARETSFLHQKVPKNQVSYMGPDGSVFTIAEPRDKVAQNQHKPNHHQHQPHQHYPPQTDLMRTSSSPTANLDPLCNQKQQELASISNQRQQQHRRLQYQVHQQLQRIYGASDRRDQNQTSDRHQFLLQKQHQHQQQQQADRMQPRNVNSAGVNFGQIHNQQQFRPGMMKNPHLMMVNSQSDQTYDSLSPASVSKQQINEGFYAIDSNHSNQRHNPISAIPEECDNDDEDEDELLIPQSVVTKRVALDRKNQLEDLHYATATAAALLSATANAAAAFAANAEKRFDKRQPANELRGCSSAVEQQNLINTIYSDAYQEVRKQQRCHTEPHPATLAAFKKHQQQHHHHRGSIYADALDPINFLNANDRRMHMGQASTSSAIYSPLVRGSNAASQSQIYSILPSSYHQYQAANFSRSAPPQPPLRRLMVRQPPVGSLNQQHHHDIIAQHHQHLLQQQQQQQQQQLRQLQHPVAGAPALTVPAVQVPAVAIVHQGKNSSIKADLIGRMLVNNILAAQQVAAKSADSSTHYAPSSATTVDRGRAIVSSSNGLVGGGLLAGGRDKIYRTPGHVFSVAPGIAPSDSSGQSNVPLVLDRELKPMGFIDRICRIDLALFWWSLLIVSFVFISAMITISRYIF